MGAVVLNRLSLLSLHSSAFVLNQNVDGRLDGRLFAPCSGAARLLTGLKCRAAADSDGDEEGPRSRSTPTRKAKAVKDASEKPKAKRTSTRKKKEAVSSDDEEEKTRDSDELRAIVKREEVPTVVEKVDDEEDLKGYEFDWPPLVVCMGEAIDEFVPLVRVCPVQCDHTLYPTWRNLQAVPPEWARTPGGPSSNMAIALARLNARVAYVGKVGDDEAGRKLVQEMNKNQVQTRGVVFDKKLRSQVQKVELRREQEQWALEPLTQPAGANLKVKDVKKGILLEAKLLHCTALSLLQDPLRTTLLSTVKEARKRGTAVFFDPNLPMCMWKSRERTWDTIKELWGQADVVEVHVEELEFLLDEALYRRKRKIDPLYGVEPGDTARVNFQKKRPIYIEYDVGPRKDNPRKEAVTIGVMPEDDDVPRWEHHYSVEELAPLLHDNLSALFVTDGTLRIHYYTPHFHGSVEGTEDVLLAPYSAERSGSGDAVVAAMIRKLTTMPEILKDEEKLKRALRFAICAGIIAQWTTGAVRCFPTENATQNLLEQIYIPALV
eukprot:jgi/Mesen1/8703/ME000052S08129